MSQEESDNNKIEEEEKKIDNLDFIDLNIDQIEQYVKQSYSTFNSEESIPNTLHTD